MDIREIFVGRKDRRIGILGQERGLVAAVLIPIIEYQGQSCLILEKRAQHMNKQPAEICFPGGSIAPSDPTEVDAAVRETCEELGLQRNDVEILAPLDILVTPFNYVVHSFVAAIRTEAILNPNPDEVEGLLYIPVEELKKNEPIKQLISLKPVMSEKYPYELIPNGRNYRWIDFQYPQLFYQWRGEVVWGITARIIEHFLSFIFDDDESRL